MPGLVRGMARTAAIVGTATATRNAVNRRQADKNMQAYADAANTTYAQPAAPPAQYAPPPPQYSPSPQVMPPPPMTGAEPPTIMPQAPVRRDDVITQLERLGTLKAQGLLTEQEFAAQKAKLLGL